MLFLPQFCDPNWQSSKNIFSQIWQYSKYESKKSSAPFHILDDCDVFWHFKIYREFVTEDSVLKVFFRWQKFITRKHWFHQDFKPKEIVGFFKIQYQPSTNWEESHATWTKRSMPIIPMCHCPQYHISSLASCSRVEIF